MTVTIDPVRRGRKQLVSELLKNNNFDLIRLLLAVAVLFSHCYVIYYGMEGNAREPLHLLTRGQVTLGTLAVDCFFIISGFLIINSFVHSRSVKSYLRKRALRICPGFIVAFLLSVFFFALLGNMQYQKTLFNWATYFDSLQVRKLMLQFALFKQPSHTVCFTSLPLSGVVNGSLWTIQYELLCYLLLPAMGVAGALKYKWVAPLMFILFYACMLLQDRTGFLYFDTHPGMWVLNLNHIPRFFAFFCCGICVYQYRAFIPRSAGLALLALAVLVLSARITQTFSSLFPLAGTYLLFYVAYSRRIRFYQFAKRADLSYGVYLYAWPIQQLVLYCLGTSIPLYYLFIISLAITLLTAYYWSWKCIEKPFMEWKKYDTLSPVR